MRNDDWWCSRNWMQLTLNDCCLWSIVIIIINAWLCCWCFHDNWSELMVLDQTLIDDNWWINDGWSCVNWSSWDSMIIDTRYIICIILYNIVQWSMVVDGWWLIVDDCWWSLKPLASKLQQAAETTGHYPKAQFPCLCPQNPWILTLGIPRMQSCKAIEAATTFGKLVTTNNDIDPHGFSLPDSQCFFQPHGLASPSSHNAGIFKEAILVQPLPNLDLWSDFLRYQIWRF